MPTFTAVSSTKEYIVFFDGICSLCNGFIDFLIKRDKHNRLQYASLQGETAQSKLPTEMVERLKTIVYYEDGRLFTESDAAIQIMIRLGGFWKIAYILKIFPALLRNWFYRLIARNRYKWFGKRDSCRMPTPEERLKILP